MPTSGLQQGWRCARITYENGNGARSNRSVPWPFQPVQEVKMVACDRSDLARCMRDLRGQKFNKWTVLDFVGFRGEASFWLCQCDCGTTRAVSGTRLRQGKSKSCGCRRGGFAWKKHGESHKTKEYRAWTSLLSRCHCPTGQGFGNYGGRGITVCARWQGAHGYENFLADMGRCPSPELSLDRIRNNEGYGPDNCRWATATQQSRNRRNSLMLTFNGATKQIHEWAEALGISVHTLKGRLKAGWKVKDVLTRPAQVCQNHINNGIFLGRR